MRKDDEAPAPADGEDKPPTKLKITFNGTAEQLEELMGMLEKLRLPDDETPPLPKIRALRARPLRRGRTSATCAPRFKRRTRK